MDRKVVVTGLGVISSIGIGKDDFWNNLIRGTSGISEVTLFDTSEFKRHKAGQVKNFKPSDFIPKEMIKFLGRASQFAIAAAKLALKDAKITEKKVKDIKSAVIIGTTMTEAQVYDISSKMFVDDGWDDITTKLMLNIFSSSIPRNLGHLLKAKGFNLLIPNACAAANYALGYGFDLIKRGEIDLAIIGGADALSRIAFQGFQRLYAMAPDKCSPFDKERKGMMLGEGAGILVLESLESASERKAEIYSQVLGYGISCDANHMTIPKKEGIAKAMSKALKNADVSTKDVDYVSAHGTGTQANDKAESGAINEVFDNREVPVSSIKSMLGHCMGAASGLESIACCMALVKGIVPPTINFETPDPECTIDCIPNKARNADVRIALNNGFAFGGNNCCVVFKNYAG
jgi:3-oxoacyl-[acyl-carrier-protein] synthase II